MYYLGYDIGSSSIKAALVDSGTNRSVAVTSFPKQEMTINSLRRGWAEQDPELWWDNVVQATRKVISKAEIDRRAIAGIGIAYQMHGLVIVDRDHQALRPAIIWSDSRAVEIGGKAFEDIGQQDCLNHLLNSPGNFTLSKLRWVQMNEPSIYERIHKFMLPGDFIAMKLSGKISTTVQGLSEAMAFDFQSNKPYSKLFEYYGIDQALLPEIQPAFSIQGKLTKEVSDQIGIPHGIPIGYRGGDQPNNAMSLGALDPGEVAGTGGTSGVIYGIADQPVSDRQNRINSFAHINHTANAPRIGILLCINGAGIQYRWIRQNMASDSISYTRMEEAMSGIPPGSDGARMLPFGNGAERMLESRDIGAQIKGLDFNRHSAPHLYRAALEGIAFAFVHGAEIVRSLGISINTLRVGNDNLFQSEIFSTTIATLLDARIDMVDVTGAIGAARAAAFSDGAFSSLREAMTGDPIIKTYAPCMDNTPFKEAYHTWENDLNNALNNC